MLVNFQMRQSELINGIPLMDKDGNRLDESSKVAARYAWLIVSILCLQKVCVHLCPQVGDKPSNLVAYRNGVAWNATGPRTDELPGAKRFAGQIPPTAFSSSPTDSIMWSQSSFYHAPVLRTVWARGAYSDQKLRTRCAWPACGQRL